jgi:ATP-dependent helicase/nuclease subunit A
METTRDEVRVMTVHGAKGLEAPVVILADTTTPPRGSHPPTLIEIGTKDGVAQSPPCIVWAPRRDDDVEAVAQAREAVQDEYENEHRRLLYVAMTRAAERLIVCGCHGKVKPKDGCWYNLIYNGLTGQPGFEETGDGETKMWRYRKNVEPATLSSPIGVAPSPPLGGEGADFSQPQCRAPTEPSAKESSVEDLPTWLTESVPSAARAAVVLPSSALPEAHRPRWRNAAQEQAQVQAQARGTLIHRLLQSLPDIEPARREATAVSFLTRTGAQFSADERSLFANQVLAILADPRFAALFAPGSRAEVPIVGRLSRDSGTEIPISGQIDRVAVTADAVLIGDYKTNRNPPTTVEQAASAHPDYVRQLALYRAVLGKIYPDRPIRAALLWTEIPGLMELPAAQLDAAAARISAG